MTIKSTVILIIPTKHYSDDFPKQKNNEKPPGYKSRLVTHAVWLQKPFAYKRPSGYKNRLVTKAVWSRQSFGYRSHLVTKTVWLQQPFGYKKPNKSPQKSHTTNPRKIIQLHQQKTKNQTKITQTKTHTKIKQKQTKTCNN